MLRYLSDNNENSQKLFVDSNIWFHSKKRLYEALTLGYELIIDPIVIYEVIKILDLEINLAKEKKKVKRVELMEYLKKRFPSLLKELHITISTINLSYKDLVDSYGVMEKYNIDIGDALIYSTLQKEHISLILSSDQDWKRLPNITMYDLN